MLKRVLFAAIFLFLPALAYAGSFVDGVYSSNLGYSVTPPKGWVRLDASNASAMQGHVPQNIDVLGTSRFDVIFFPPFSKVDTSLAADTERLEKNKAVRDANKNPDPEDIIPPASDMTQPPEFSPSMSIIVLNSVPSKMKPEMAKVYADKLIAQVREMSDFSDFEIKASTMDNTLPAGDDFNFVLGFRRNQKEYKLEQTIIFRPNESETVVVTCINDANEYEADKMWCKSAVTSLKFK